MDWLENLVYGLVTSSYLIVATLGFAVVARVEKFLNIAHAEYITVGAFVTYGVTVGLDLPLVVAALVAMASVAALAVGVSKTVYRPMTKAGGTVLMITSIGVLYALQGGIETIVKPGVYSLDLDVANFDAGPIRIGPYDLVIIAAAILSVTGIHLLLTRTRMGLQWRAIASDPSLAAARGIDAKSASVRMWIIVGALCGLAGVLLGLQGALSTDISFAQILMVVAVAVLAGIGSIYGVVVAALVVGISMDMSTLVIPSGYRELVAFGAVLLVLAFRPNGLAGTNLARREA
jgi:neutral amino acid transport system permease protein